MTSIDVVSTLSCENQPILESNGDNNDNDENNDNDNDNDLVLQMRFVLVPTDSSFIQNS